MLLSKDQTGGGPQACARLVLRWPEYSVQAMSVPAFSAMACPPASVLRRRSSST